MAKERLQTIAEELDAEPEEVARLARKHLPTEMLGGNSGLNLWIDREGVKVLQDALIAEELTPKIYFGKVIRPAPNPAYVYTNIPEIGKAVPMLVPRQFAQSIIGKRVKVERIEDERGESFRWFRE